MGLLNALPVIGDIIGGAANYYAAQKDAQSREAINAEQMKLAREQMAEQEEYAKMGLRWKVADAEAAGLHPLAALGATTSTYSPVGFSMMESGSGEKFRALGKMGQDLSRSVMATMTGYERQKANLEIENMKLQNDLVRDQLMNSRLERMNKVGSPFPADSEIGLTRTADGGYTITPSELWQNRAGSSIAGQVGHALHYKLMPFFGAKVGPEEIMYKGKKLYYRWPGVYSEYKGLNDGGFPNLNPFKAINSWLK